MATISITFPKCLANENVFQIQSKINTTYNILHMQSKISPLNTYISTSFHQYTFSLHCFTHNVNGKTFVCSMCRWFFRIFYPKLFGKNEQYFDCIATSQTYKHTHIKEITGGWKCHKKKLDHRQTEQKKFIGALIFGVQHTWKVQIIQKN